MPQPHRIARLDGREEIGDPKAPPGSLDWIRSLRAQTNQLKRDARMSALQLKGSLTSLLKDERWRQLVDEDGRPWSAWEWFCQHHEPWGLGMAPEQVAAILAETDPNKTIGAVLRAGPGRPKKGEDNGNECNHFSERERGNGRDYALARLDRDRPDLAASVRAGDLSANAAAIEAGFRKPPSPLAQLRSAWKRASAQERDEFDEWKAGFLG